MDGIISCFRLVLHEAAASKRSLVEEVKRRRPPPLRTTQQILRKGRTRIEQNFYPCLLSSSA